MGSEIEQQAKQYLVDIGYPKRQIPRMADHLVKFAEFKTWQTAAQLEVLERAVRHYADKGHWRVIEDRAFAEEYSPPSWLRTNGFDQAQAALDEVAKIRRGE